MLCVSFLFEASRLKKEISSGRLSDQGIMKARMAGQLKPFYKWRKGVEKGTNNLIKNAGAERITPPSNSSVIERKGRVIPAGVPNMAVRGDDRYVVTPSGNSAFYKRHNLSPREAVLSNRHEADEARYGKQYKDKYGINLTGRLSKKHGTSEKHVSARVPKREMELDRVGKAYGFSNFLRKHRAKTGEDKLIKRSDKEIKKIEDRRIKNMMNKPSKSSSSEMRFSYSRKERKARGEGPRFSEENYY